jgi:hypothetical protein
MKTNPSIVCAAAVLVAGIFSAQTANAQRVDPATGLPALGAMNASHVDPRTGFRVSNKDGRPVFNGGADPSSAAFDVINRETFAKGAALNDAIFGWPLNEVRELTANGRYDEALKLVRSLHNQRADTKSFMPLLFEWFNMAGKYPKAKKALIEIRDHDVREFNKSRGDTDLFWEVKLINDNLNQPDDTVALFKTIHERDYQLAGRCYPYVEDLMVQKGEYELCLNCIGDPQARFESCRADWKSQTKWALLLQEIQKKSAQHLGEQLEKAKHLQIEQTEKLQAYQQKKQKEFEEFRRGLREKYPQLPPSEAANIPRFVSFSPGPRLPAMPPRTPPDLGKLAADRFVRKVCALVEILAATDHLADAEKIHEEAATVLDDARLRSAVSDAQTRIHHKPTENQNGFQREK